MQPYQHIYHNQTFLYRFIFCLYFIVVRLPLLILHNHHFWLKRFGTSIIPCLFLIYINIFFFFCFFFFVGSLLKKKKERRERKLIRNIKSKKNCINLSI